MLDFSCFYDASLVQPCHMYLTANYLCFHLHGQKGKEVSLLFFLYLLIYIYLLASTISSLRLIIYILFCFLCIQKVIPWKDVCDIQKKNTARVIPNAVVIRLVDHKEVILLIYLIQKKPSFYYIIKGFRLLSLSSFPFVLSFFLSSSSLLSSTAIIATN